MSERTNGMTGLSEWFQQHAVAIVAAAAIGAGGGYIGGSQVDSYRLTALEEQVGDLTEEVRSLTRALATAGEDRWRRSDHERWERGELVPQLTDLEARVRALEIGQRTTRSGPASLTE